MPASRPSEGDHERLLELINGCWTTQAICAAVELGVVEALVAAPADAATVAVRIGTHPAATSRLLRALVALGVCRSDGLAFALTGTGRLLSVDHPKALRRWAILAGRHLWSPWHGLADSVRTGASHHALAGRPGRFDALDHDAGEAATFHGAMAELTALVTASTAACVADHLAAATGHVVDVGAGHGGLLAAVLTMRPGWRGTALDCAHARDGAERVRDAAGLADRMAVVSGDFFDKLPSGDALLLKSVLHDWDDERCIVLLRTCARALPPEGTLLLVERLMPEVLHDLPAHRRLCRSDLNMLIGPGGSERGGAQFAALLGAAGLRLVDIAEVAAGFNVMAAQAR